jgi:hypothetical protein
LGIGAAVTKLADGSAFRAQLIMPEQRQLYDYWLKIAAGRKMPVRADLNPAAIPRLLPGLSLIDVAHDISKCRVRLAGTKLREIFDREITGHEIDALEWGDKHDYWLASYRRPIESGLPAQGVLKGPRSHKEHLVQYWLKLPLANAAGTKVEMLLCYDSFVPANQSVENRHSALSA